MNVSVHYCSKMNKNENTISEHCSADACGTDNEFSRYLSSEGMDNEVACSISAALGFTDKTAVRFVNEFVIENIEEGYYDDLVLSDDHLLELRKICQAYQDAYVPDEIVDEPDANGHTLQMVQLQLRNAGRILLYHTRTGSDCTCFYNREVIHSTTTRTKGRVVTSFRQYASWQDWFEYCGVETQNVTLTCKDKRSVIHGTRFPNGFFLSGGCYYPTLRDWLVSEKVLTVKKTAVAEALRTEEARPL